MKTSAAPRFMPNLQSVEPFPFTQEDLQPDRLAYGMNHALASFENWRDGNGDLIAEHTNDFTAAIDSVANQYSRYRQIGGLILPRMWHSVTSQTQREFVEYFGYHNLGERLEPESTEFLQRRIQAGYEAVKEASTLWRPRKRDSLDVSLGVLKRFAPELQDTPEIAWLETRVKHLRTILPEKVMSQGALSKVIRTIMGVVIIASYDVADKSAPVRRDHLRHIIPGAYALGATYALVDDVLQSNADNSIKRDDKDRYSQAVLDVATSGNTLDLSCLPDHPLTDELDILSRAALENYPFKSYRHLYYAVESMYGAQNRDARLTPEAVKAQGGIRSMYHDAATKAALTRVIANIVGRRSVSCDNYTRFLNGFLGSQLKDDIEDHIPDALEGSCTVFTMPYNPGDPNPLYDLFAFNAYVRFVLWKGDSNAGARYARFGAEYGPYFARNRDHGPKILQKYPHTKEIKHFIDRATSLTPRQARKVLPPDMLLQEVMRTTLRVRSDVDPRTFLADNLPFINSIIGSTIKKDSGIVEIANYSLEAGGKRLRPALTLMLADALGIPYERITPLLQSIELVHTSSLMFDDLPAQDNSTLRRGKPTAHVAYPEWGAQLAAISMMSRSFGVLTDLAKHFPVERVNEVIRYADAVLGFDGLCRGQAMDLESQDPNNTNLEQILEMYRMKTSLMIEAALVPLMILTGRSEQQIVRIKEYAHHAGIVFQIKDDILDATADKSQIGKDVQCDIKKANVVQLYGLEAAESILQRHLLAATYSLQQLPFDTNLLKAVLTYFAIRKK